MAANEETLNKLHYLETLYRQGYHSDVVDQSVNKLIALERAAAQRALEDLRQRLSVFEGHYQMSSEDFYQRFRAGELGDAAEFVEWSVFCEMVDSVRERLELLEANTGQWTRKVT
jgi:hypothetical protein